MTGVPPVLPDFYRLIRCETIGSTNDEAKRLAQQDPAGGIVSLHELPDFLRLVNAQNARLR